MTKLATLKKRLMKNPKFRKEYEKVDAEFSIVEALIHARTLAKLSQAEVAKRIGTTQSAIARLEAGNTEPTIPTLRRYAEATGKQLRIELDGRGTPLPIYFGNRNWAPYVADTVEQMRVDGVRRGAVFTTSAERYRCPSGAMYAPVWLS